MDLGDGLSPWLLRGCGRLRGISDLGLGFAGSEELDFVFRASQTVVRSGYNYPMHVIGH